MGIPRLPRHHNLLSNKENSPLSPAPRPWDNPPSALSTFSNSPSNRPIRPSQSNISALEPFTPLLKPANPNVPMSVSPRRKGDGTFSTVGAEGFRTDGGGMGRKRERGGELARTVSVVDRRRMFEGGEREKPTLFVGGIDAFIPRNSPVVDFEREENSNFETNSVEENTSSEEEREGVGVMLPVKMKVGNREVTPLLEMTKPVPLVGLPIPIIEALGGRRSIKQVREQTRDRLSVRQPKIPKINAADLGLHGETEHIEKKKDGMNNCRLDFEDPHLKPRFSYRQSVRMSKPSKVEENDNHLPRSSFRISTRLEPLETTEPANLNFFPRSTSFLDFDDDDRLSPLKQGGNDIGTGEKDSSVWGGLSFDDPDSFDTFATLPHGLQDGKLIALDGGKKKGNEIRPGTDESEKPEFPMMSFRKKDKGIVEEDDDGTLDVPKRFTRRPGAEGALKELQRASVTAGNEISESLRMMGTIHKESQTKQQASVKKEDKVCRVQGDVYLRSRIFRRWNLRYGSIVHQGYFGAVLLLFRSDARGFGAGFALSNSKMIALTDCTVRKVDNIRRPELYMFELKTSQRTYMFACNDDEGRDFWINNLRSPVA